MSGGSYDYFYSKMSDAADALRSRHADAPHVLALAALLDRIATVMQDIEWADSCDSSWDDELDASIRAVLPTAAPLASALLRAQQWHAMLGEEIDRVHQLPPNAAITPQPEGG